LPAASATDADEAVDIGISSRLVPIL